MPNDPFLSIAVRVLSLLQQSQGLLELPQHPLQNGGSQSPDQGGDQVFRGLQKGCTPTPLHIYAPWWGPLALPTSLVCMLSPPPCPPVQVPILQVEGVMIGDSSIILGALSEKLLGET